MILVGDVGGSKSEFAVMEGEEVVWRKVLDPANPKELGMSNLLDVLKKVLEEIKTNFEKVVLGVAGVGKDSDEIAEEVRRMTGTDDVKVVSDSVIAYVGAMGGLEKGVVILAGTGSIVMAFDGKDFHKFGGWGHILGDEGGGYRLSLEALRLYLKWIEGRIESSPVVRAVENFFDLSGREDVIDLVYKGKKRDVASFAKDFLKVVLEDERALGILRSQIVELLEPVPIAVGIGSRRISYAGGLFKSEVYRSTVRNVLREMGYDLLDPVSGPLEGAMILALSR